MANGLQIVSEIILFLIIIIYYDYQFHYYYAMAMGRHLSNAADTATPLFICLSFPLCCAIKIKIQKVSSNPILSACSSNVRNSQFLLRCSFGGQSETSALVYTLPSHLSELVGLLSNNL